MSNTPDKSESAYEATQLFQTSDTHETISRPKESLPSAMAGTSDFSRQDSPRARVAIVAGRGESLSDQERETLRARLLAGTLVILFGFAIYLVRSYFDDRPLQGFHTFVVMALTAMAGLLSSRRELSTKELRWTELAVFGLPVIFFTPYQYYCMKQMMDANDPVGIVAIYKNVTSYWFALLVIYGLYVPNRWKRAAVAVTPMVVLPVATGVLAGLLNPMIGEHLDLRELSDTLMILCVGALCSAYGAEVISSLRKEARDAQQFGQYRLLNRLGQGGMGEVYKAEHQLLKRPCAIKLIRPEHASDPQMLARFEREVKTTAKLTHWNTIDIYDYGRTDDGTFYYVMEFLPGLSLREVISREGALPPERAVHFLCQICDALNEAHASSFIHRDINPNNIFITQRGGVHDVAKLLDFGLVKSVSKKGDQTNITQTGTVSGTPKYMSPEQAFGEEEPGRASDLYSLGAVGYAMLSGKAPFEGQTAMHIMIAHARDPVMPLRKLNDQVSEALEKIIMRCLEKRPQDRYPSAAALRADLDECLPNSNWTQNEAALWWRETGSSTPPLETADLPAASKDS
ncbi:MAG: serine/threonine protein kinase [Planctomycetes bacterium]|nr:serine/threonine protein kinase [Planctomycetota bacterium]